MFRLFALVLVSIGVCIGSTAGATIWCWRWCPKTEQGEESKVARSRRRFWVAAGGL